MTEEFILQYPTCPLCNETAEFCVCTGCSQCGRLQLASYVCGCSNGAPEQLLFDERVLPRVLCSRCGLDVSVCECARVVCISCNRSSLQDELCNQCSEDTCLGCCDEHEWCPTCDERVTSTCERCSGCEDCCECFLCSGCNRRCNPDTICGTCDTCERCCECSYCERCRENHTPHTAWCGDCDGCLDTCECLRSIMPYETDPLGYLAFHGHPDSNIYLGVELEVECSANRASIAQSWIDKAPNWLICKEDGSLNSGFELVTAPSDLATHHREWTRLLSNTHLTRDLKSWDTSTCGLHVHVSRKPLSRLTIGKILVFVNSPKTRDTIIKIAGRDSNHYSHYDLKTATSGVVRYEDGPKGLRTSYGHSRYEAVNLRNADTLEFRIFKGTLDLEHVLADIEFVDAVVRYCMQCSIRDCESWPTFWAFIENHKKTYANLIGHMGDK